VFLFWNSDSILFGEDQQPVEVDLVVVVAVVHMVPQVLPFVLVVEDLWVLGLPVFVVCPLGAEL